MPNKKGRFTVQEKTFVQAMAATGDKAYAKAVAGYRGNSSATRTYERAAVQAEIVREQTRRLYQEGLPIAVDTLIGMSRSSSTPAGARVQAAKVLLEYTIGRDSSTGERALSEMTAADIQRELAETRIRAAALEYVAADMAQPVIEAQAVEPAPAPKPEPEPDYFGG